MTNKINDQVQQLIKEAWRTTNAPSPPTHFRWHVRNRGGQTEQLDPLIFRMNWLDQHQFFLQTFADLIINQCCDLVTPENRVTIQQHFASSTLTDKD